VPARISERVEVDIATQTVGDDEDIYIVRPGAGYALYNEFQRTSRVFLDSLAFRIVPSAEAEAEAGCTSPDDRPIA